MTENLDKHNACEVWRLLAALRPLFYCGHYMMSSGTPWKTIVSVRGMSRHPQSVRLYPAKPKSCIHNMAGPKEGKCAAAWHVYKSHTVFGSNVVLVKEFVINAKFKASRFQIQLWFIFHCSFYVGFHSHQCSAFSQQPQDSWIANILWIFHIVLVNTLLNNTGFIVVSQKSVQQACSSTANLQRHRVPLSILCLFCPRSLLHIFWCVLGGIYGCIRL